MSHAPLRGKKISDLHLTKSAEIVKCLGHPLRLRLLEALEHGEMTVSDLQEYANMSQAAVSQQLGILRGRGVVDFRRDGVYAHYRIIEPKVSKILACIRDCDGESSPF
jgi:DNA-binding transcriptional ArsR family regulator